MSPVIARSTEPPRPPGPPRPPEIPSPAPFPPPHAPVVPLPPPTGTPMPVPHVRMRPSRWEYKRLTRTADAPDLDEAELNELGRDGWELVGVVANPQGAQFYFKRERA